MRFNLSIFMVLFLHTASAQMSYKYNSNNQLEKVGYPNDVATIYGYDSLGNRVSRRTIIDLDTNDFYIFKDDLNYCTLGRIYADTDNKNEFVMSVLKNDIVIKRTTATRFIGLTDFPRGNYIVHISKPNIDTSKFLLTYPIKIGDQTPINFERSDFDFVRFQDRIEFYTPSYLPCHPFIYTFKDFSDNTTTYDTVYSNRKLYLDLPTRHYEICITILGIDESVFKECFLINTLSVPLIDSSIKICEVYPNPFEEYIELRFGNDATFLPLVVQIINSSGSVVYEQDFTDEESLTRIQTSELSAGVYTLILKSNNLEQRVKVVKK